MITLMSFFSLQKISFCISCESTSCYSYYYGKHFFYYSLPFYFHSKLILLKYKFKLPQQETIEFENK